ncbi:hypothetical protein KZP16_05485 [Bifidobacterium pseudocatenulatum]|uniref:hypothetical protein n=1 Tax=Bifidobacterium pseudocatenulatum TaxID=28026 RepID=UPI001CFE26A6|nr:hypothetical protein [Bifidobacterium pseudocatenulatum]MCB4916186.1 hypothetical protein [Bifidobacterium pseudocatenulatum]
MSKYETREDTSMKYVLECDKWSPADPELCRIVNVPAVMLDPIDLPCWRRALRALEPPIQYLQPLIHVAGP